MKMDWLNRWLTLGANLAVLVGIIVLVLELDQNRDMIRAQTRNDISRQISDFLSLVASDRELASLQRRAWAGEELTTDEETQYFLLLSANTRFWENIHYQYRQGMFDQSEFEGERSMWRRLINSNKRFAPIWCSIKEGYSTDFASEIDSLLVEKDC